LDALGVVMSINAIDRKSVHQITSGQVIVDLSTAVKELVENSLDANASSIEVKFRNYGLESVEVSDNGDGIAAEDYDAVAQNHYTSKLRRFEDVEKVETLGFRGEAMSSLCALATVTIVTSQTGTLATKLEFDHNGNITGTSKTPGKKGTIVTFSEIFSQLPVRRKDLEKNFKREFTKAVNLLQAYAIISKGVMITISHVSAGGKRSVLLRSNGTDLKDNLVSVYGANALDGLVPLDLDLEWLAKSVLKEKIDSKVHISGYVSQPVFGKGRAAGDRQLFFINSRPCQQTRMAKAFNEVYRQFNTVQLPFVVCNFTLDPRHYDVNVSPDKRTILLHDETVLIERLKEQLAEFFEAFGHTVPRKVDIPTPIDRPRLFQSKLAKLTQKFRAGASHDAPQEEHEVDVKEDQSELEGSIEQESEEDNEPVSQELVSDTAEAAKVEEEEEERHNLPDENGGLDGEQDDDDDMDFVVGGNVSEEIWHSEESEEEGQEEDLGRKSMFKEGDDYDSLILDEINIEYMNQVKRKNDAESVTEADGETPIETPPSNRSLRSLPARLSRPQSNDSSYHSSSVEVTVGKGMTEHVPLKRRKMNKRQNDVRVTDLRPFSADDSIPDAENGETSLEAEPISGFHVNPNSKYRTLNTHVSSETSMEEIVQGWKRISKVGASLRTSKQRMGVKQVNILDNQETIENQLNMTVRKDDFNNMKIIGQFNLGFILVSRTKSDGCSDLFVIDQHASDEKANFEKFQAETIMQHQPLVVPRRLQLTAVEELTLVKNLPILEKNGFIIELDEDEPPGSQCKLASLPFSKTTIFDESDLNELLYLIHESPGNQSVRCSKLRAMFAMRACRSSIMVGQSLTRSTMERVVKRLAELDKPWNCPHGRPTLRHMTCVDQWTGFSEDLI
jgi:DNA mismatch repair protein PMS2